MTHKEVASEITEKLKVQDLIYSSQYVIDKVENLILDVLDLRLSKFKQS